LDTNFVSVHTHYTHRCPFVLAWRTCTHVNNNNAKPLIYYSLEDKERIQYEKKQMYKRKVSKTTNKQILEVKE